MSKRSRGSTATTKTRKPPYELRGTSPVSRRPNATVETFQNVVKPLRGQAGGFLRTIEEWSRKVEQPAIPKPQPKESVMGVSSSNPIPEGFSPSRRRRSVARPPPPARRHRSVARPPPPARRHRSVARPPPTSSSTSSSSRYEDMEVVIDPSNLVVSSTPAPSSPARRRRTSATSRPKRTSARQSPRDSISDASKF